MASIEPYIVAGMGPFNHLIREHLVVTTYGWRNETPVSLFVLFCFHVSFMHEEALESQDRALSVLQSDRKAFGG